MLRSIATNRLPTDETEDEPPFGKVLPLSSLMRMPTTFKFGPVIVLGNMIPKVGSGKLNLSTQPFKPVGRRPSDYPAMELCIENGRPTMKFSTDDDKNSTLDITAGYMTCQVAATLQRNPAESPSTTIGWKAMIIQIFKDNTEVRNYGPSKDPDSVDFSLNQYFLIDGDHCSAPILDKSGCVCDGDSDPSYSSSARQQLDMQDIKEGKMLFGKLSSEDQPRSSARVSYNPKTETGTVCKFFHDHKLTADTYYLNEISKQSSVFTYLAIVNTTQSEPIIFTPMAVQWFFDFTTRRVKGTDEFKWYQTPKNQRAPIAWSAAHPIGFPHISPGLLGQYHRECRNRKKCQGYATFNNSIQLQPKLTSDT